MNILNGDVKEVGFGLATGDWTNGGHVYKSVMLTQDFTRSSLSPVLTGVAYRDRDNDNFYTPAGEGRPGLTVTAESALGLVLQTSTYGSGGYSLTLIPGDYHVTFSGDGIDSKSFNVHLGQENVKLDLIIPDISATNERPWMNRENALDVTADGRIEALDVLVLVNEINSSGGGELSLPGGMAVPPPFFDVSGDNLLSAIDVLMVVNGLNSHSSLAALLSPMSHQDAPAPITVPEPASSILAIACAAILSLWQPLLGRRKGL